MNNQSKKNQKNRAFLAAIAMLLVSAIVITTASFAWFTLGRSAQVNNLNLKVTKEGEGIAISANAKEFTDTLAFEDLQGTSSTAFVAISEDYNYFPERISPASSEFKLNDLPVFFMGGIDKVAKTMSAYAATSTDGKTIFKDEDAAGTSGKVAGFYAFDVFIKLEGRDTAKINMSNSEITVATNGTDKDGNTYEDAGKADFTDETAKAMRIGFVNCGTTTTENAAPSGSEAVIFGTADSEARSTKPVNAAGEYAVAEGANIISSLSTSYGCQVDQGSENVPLTLSRGVNQIRVYIWMEGQDANCTNDLMSEYVTAHLVFTLV